MRVGILLGMAVGLVACAESPSPVAPLRVMDENPTLAATVDDVEQTVTFHRTLFIACANEGAGEDVELSGLIQIRSHTTEDANGGIHVSSHVRPDGVIGVGETSGLMYRGTGGTFEAEGYSAAGDPATYSYVNNFRIIGQGPGNNMTIHYTVHQTINANGELTADVDLNRSECK